MVFAHKKSTILRINFSTIINANSESLLVSLKLNWLRTEQNDFVEHPQTLTKNASPDLPSFIEISDLMPLTVM